MKKRALVGLGLGVGFAVLQFVVLGAAESVYRDSSVQPLRSFILTLETLNAPVEWLGYVWHVVLHLPQWDIVTGAIVAIITALAQWGLIGFLGGLWWGFKSASSASGRGGHVWPVVLVGGGAIVACGLLALILSAVFARPAKPDGLKARPKPNVAAPEQEHVDEAFMAAAAALEANPNDPEALYRLGVTFASRGRVDVAMIQFRRAIEIRPNYAEAHYQLGLALAKKGRLAAAIACYRQALLFKPDFAEARQHLKAIETNEGKKAQP